MKKALPTKHAKHTEKMDELAYAELTQGRELTRLPHTHKGKSCPVIHLAITFVNQ